MLRSTPQLVRSRRLTPPVSTPCPKNQEASLIGLKGCAPRILRHPERRLTDCVARSLLSV
jgi:hypothetical protein